MKSLTAVIGISLLVGACSSPASPPPQRSAAPEPTSAGPEGVTKVVAEVRGIT
jgi:hypothetical protein